jgi:hypothetical protein
MKKLLQLFILSLALIAATRCGAETPEVLSAWVGRPLTSNETALAEYEACTTTRRGPILTCYAWGVVPNSYTNTIVPQSACDQVYGVGAVSNVPLWKFSLKCQPAGDSETESVFTLSANYNAGPPPWTRRRSTDADDVMAWLDFTGAYGVNITNILNITEYKALFSAE